ncbi:MAG: hypothetical protein ACK55X_15710 [Synechococcaceae cyanobacterium]
MSTAAPAAPAALLLLAAPIAAVLAAPPPAQAGSRTLQVAPLISRTPSGPCPTTVVLQETHQPYREGSYALEGTASLPQIASGWRLEGRDAFSATWVAPLKAPYQRCRAGAGLVRIDNEPVREPSYLRMRFEGGQLRLILDMTGLRDPNGYTPVILSAGLRQGLPVWRWGGSD